MNDDIIARRLIISGKVQGVGFRAFVVQQATALRIDGFVRNRKDGSVEALVKGDPAGVKKLIALCVHGPLGAVVDDVKVAEAQGIVDNGFRQLPTV